MLLTPALAISRREQKGIMLQMVNWTAFDRIGDSSSVIQNYSVLTLVLAPGVRDAFRRRS
jgi:hypothetical protein